METILSRLANGLQDPFVHSVSDWNPVLIIYWFLKNTFHLFSALWPFLSYLEIIQEIVRIWAIKPGSCSPSLVMSYAVKRKITLERQMCRLPFYHELQQLLSIILQRNVTPLKYFPTIPEINSELPTILKNMFLDQTDTNDLFRWKSETSTRHTWAYNQGFILVLLR